jgi:hypothetical protein
MSKSRAFTFKIEKAEEIDWENICNLVKNKLCEYITTYKSINTNKQISIKGFIRFINPKYYNSVKKIFNNKADIEIQKNNDNFYKELFSKNEYFFEDGNSAKNNNRNILKKLSEEKDKLFNELIEEKDKLFNDLASEKEKITNQFVEHQINIISQQSVQIQELLKLKNNESEQLTQITNICLAIAKNNPSVTNTNSNSNSNSNNKINNKFNLNIFLNEHCKNAVNLIDFVKGIQIELQDLLLYNKVGHAEAVSKIFNNAYKKLDLTMRPIHCTDLKRETVYVRNKDEWLNDETKEISEKAMEIVSSSSFNQMKQWKEANPDYQKSQEKNIEYMKLMKNVLGGTSDAEESAEKKKIIKNLSQNAFLDKDQALTAMNP